MIKKKTENLFIKYFFLSFFFGGGGDLRIEKKTNSQLLLELLILVSEITEWLPDYAKQILKGHRKVSNI